ncbi:rhomboid family intramembrane serine protease [Roseiconus nitratireducens]|uniref:Rhomboid family intramembrane serine protease n=1 Tax=Roseiconus nitratireducens TaxID=2605748 RepID=A0A5M6CZ56_9BACT|nr:rhomboid family intramembrane serine protease [Roseiconus nitratireducens]KAA5540403.1 rhomboid family intramembrane serine protease [Roseiconus nitratireducens]
MGLYDRDYGRDDETTPWDQQRRTQVPKSMTIILVVVTVVIFFADMLSMQQVAPGVRASRFVEWFGCWKDTLISPWKWYQFISYGFLHDQNNIFHIAFNMFGLFVFGRPVEDRLGRWEFLRFYLVSMLAGGIVGCLTYWVMGVPNGVVIGASGSVIAVTILFACFYPHVNILLMMVFPVKAWIVAVIFVVSNLLGSLTMLSGNAAGGGTAFTVHVAGAAFALLYFFQGWNLKWLDFSGRGDELKRSMRRTKLKIHDPDAKLRREEDDVDRILAKIHESGEGSLTRSERKTLERHSRRQRENRNRGNRP